VVDCPYICTSPWRQIPNILATQNGYTRLANNVGTGGVPYSSYLRIYVESPLRGNTSVTTVVPIMVLVSAGEDFKLSAPSVPTLQFFNSAPDTPFHGSPMESDPIHEMNRRTRGINSYFSEAPPVEYDGDVTRLPINICGGALASPTFGDSAMEFANGEVVVSLRSLIKRFQIVSDGFSSTPTVGSVRAIYPYYFPPRISTDLGRTNYLESFMQLFRFYNGGMRFMLADCAQSATASTSRGSISVLRYIPDFNLVASQPSFSAGQISLDKTGFTAGGPLGTLYNGNTSSSPIPPQSAQLFPSSVMQNVSTDWGMEFETPYYTRWPIMVREVPTYPDTLSTFYGSQIRNGSVPDGIVIIENLGANNECILYRAAAEDFSMSYALGAPLCHYTQNFGA